MQKQKFLLLITFFVLLGTLGLGCRNRGQSVASLPQVDLLYWTVWNEPDHFADSITAFRKLHPNVHITVKKVPFDGYEKALIEAWARGDGPDIFSIPNSSIGQYQDFITPLPEKLKLPTLVTSGGCTKDTKVVTQEIPTLSPDRIDELFIPTVADDTIFNNQVYGLPLSADTLALLYNKDLLNAARIVVPPQTWKELVDDIDTTKTSLTIENNGDLVQSGTALGTADNISRSVDLLSLLMMQQGTQMTDSLGKVVTFTEASKTESDFVPGQFALNFYAAFADPSKVSYAWNDKQPDAQEAFATGKVAFFIGYQYQEAALRLQNPQLNFGLAPVPQIQLGPASLDYAHYWEESVSKQSKHSDEAWDFIQFVTSTDQTKIFLEKAKKPTALRKLIPLQQNDLRLGVFANQLLIAKDWYHGYDSTVMESAMKDMIRDVNLGKPAEDALSLAERKIQPTLKKE